MKYDDLITVDDSFLNPLLASRWPTTVEDTLAFFNNAEDCLTRWAYFSTTTDTFQQEMLDLGIICDQVTREIHLVPTRRGMLPSNEMINNESLFVRDWIILAGRLAVGRYLDLRQRHCLVFTGRSDIVMDSLLRDNQDAQDQDALSGSSTFKPMSSFSFAHTHYPMMIQCHIFFVELFFDPKNGRE